MPIRLELRGEISRAMIYWSPIFAVVLTFIAGIIMFAILGVDPIAAIFTFFIEPLNSIDGGIVIDGLQKLQDAECMLTSVNPERAEQCIAAYFTTAHVWSNAAFCGEYDYFVVCCRARMQVHSTKTITSEQQDCIDAFWRAFI